MVDYIVISGSGSVILGQSVSKMTHSEFCELDFKHFPDNEVYVRIPQDVSHKKVCVIQSMQSADLRPNDLLLEFLFTIETLRDLGADEIVGIVPYLAYSRQDKRFLDGESISSKIVAHLIREAGISKIYCFDSHVNRTIPLEELFCCSAYDLSGFSEIGRFYSKNYELNDPLILAPDAGSKRWAEIVSKTLNCDHDYLEKKRLDGKTVVTKHKNLDTKDRDVIIVDDIISTGGTIINAIKMLGATNPNRIFVSAIHGLFVNSADSRIVLAGATEIIVTNSVESKYSRVDLAPVIAKEVFGL